MKTWPNGSMNYLSPISKVTSPMKIAIGSDHRGVELRLELGRFLESIGHEPIDCGYVGEDSCDYPDIAAEVCKKIVDGDSEAGILLCGTGIGMSIAANKFQSIRAAVCNDSVSARDEPPAQ